VDIINNSKLKNLKIEYHESGNGSINIWTLMFYLVDFILDFFNVIKKYLFTRKEREITRIE